MSRQSARLWFDGKDHKDIYFRGKYHDKMYVGGELVWEKLPSVPTVGIMDIKNVKTVVCANDKFMFLQTTGWLEAPTGTVPFQTARPSHARTYWMVSSHDGHVYAWLSGTRSNGDGLMFVSYNYDTNEFTNAYDLEDMDFFQTYTHASFDNMIADPNNDAGVVFFVSTGAMTNPANDAQALGCIAAEGGTVNTEIHPSSEMLHLAYIRAVVETPTDVICLHQLARADWEDYGTDEGMDDSITMITSSGQRYDMPCAGLNRNVYMTSYDVRQSTGMHGIYFLMSGSINDLVCVDASAHRVTELVHLTEFGVDAGVFYLASNENETRALCSVNGVAQVWVFPNAGNSEHTVIDTPDIGTPTGIAYANGYWFYGGSDRCIYEKV